MEARKPSPEQVELETKIAFLEHTLDELNDVVLEQSRTIDALGERLARVEALVQRAGDGGDDDAASSDLEAHRPPHY